MSIFGTFTVYCNNCGAKQEYPTRSAGGFWRVSNKWMVCSEECHWQMSIKDARSILGKDTPDDYQYPEKKES